MHHTAAEINNAILECAKECWADDDPADCAQAFGWRLLATGQWSQDQIKTVTEGALAVVARLPASTS